jgi:hypothetical protein
MGQPPRPHPLQGQERVQAHRTLRAPRQASEAMPGETHHRCRTTLVLLEL